MKVQWPSGAAITSPQLAMLRSGRFLIGEMYSFYLADGRTAFFTNLDVPLTYNGNTFLANSIRIDGLKLKLEVGVNVDEQDIKISAFPGDTLAGAEFLSSVLDGALDGGYIARDRAFWSGTANNAAENYALAPDLVVRLTWMRVSTINKGGRTHVELKLKSPMVLLNIDMPRNYYSPGCVHTLFDSGCTLLKAAFSNAGVVDSGATLLRIPWRGGVLNPTGGDGLPYYAQGRVLFLSGPNENAQFSVANNDSSGLNLMQPMDVLPNVGDTFVAYAGCSKTLATCTNKFSNQVNWRGFDLIPPVYISL